MASFGAKTSSVFQLGETVRLRLLEDLFLNRSRPQLTSYIKLLMGSDHYNADYRVPALDTEERKESVIIAPPTNGFVGVVQYGPNGPQGLAASINNIIARTHYYASYDRNVHFQTGKKIAYKTGSTCLQ